MKCLRMTDVIIIVIIPLLLFIRQNFISWIYQEQNIYFVSYIVIGFWITYCKRCSDTLQGMKINIDIFL